MEKPALPHDPNYRSISEHLQSTIHKGEVNLKESEERYHRMIDEVQDYAILLLDIEGNIQNWNKGAEKIKGYPEKDIIGKNFRIFYQDTDRQDKLPERLINEAYTQGRASHEGWRVRNDGTTFWGSVVITALHDSDNAIVGFSKVTRDLTEKKLAEDRIKDYARDIELRNKQLEEYAYIASHDLQEPLRKIQVFAEMMQNSLDDKEAALHYLSKISTSASRMSHLIKDVLKYSQVSETGGMFAWVDLNKIISDIQEDYDLLIREKNVAIKVVSLPAIYAIPIQMHQLFSNLVGNAIKFCNASPCLEIWADEVSSHEAAQLSGMNAARKYVRITFKDNGQGFDPQYAEQVFKMFKRLTNNAGTGIGLALCKKIVENHGGVISVTSEQGSGSVFTVVLPVE
jgi:PAS domain S-box-containing protein